MRTTSEIIHSLTDDVMTRDCRLLLFLGLGLGRSDHTTGNRFSVEDDPVILERCHRMAESGLLIFQPERSSPNSFLVTEAGAAWYDETLPDDAIAALECARTFSVEPIAPYEEWRQAVRQAHLKGLPVPPMPADVPEPATVLLEEGHPPILRTEALTFVF